MKIRNWIIKKLGGHTAAEHKKLKNDYDRSLSALSEQCARQPLLVADRQSKRYLSGVNNHLNIITGDDRFDILRGHLDPNVVIVDGPIRRDLVEYFRSRDVFIVDLRSPHQRERH